MNKKLWRHYVAVLCCALVIMPPAHADRVKDLATVAAVRTNQLVGYGIVAPEFDWDDYKGVDLKGKVLLMMMACVAW